jgi:hypothetical protein
MEVPALWRPEADLNAHFLFLILGQAVIAFFLTSIFARYIAPENAVSGASLGIMIALLIIGGQLITYAVQPLTPKILCFWIAGTLAELGIAGAIVGAIYRPQTTESVN